MIRGTVDANHEAVVPLRLRGPSGVELEVDAILDTGYTRSLILPPDTVLALGLVQQTDSTVYLGDGTKRQCGVYAVEIEWDNNWREVLATEIDCSPLIGTRLLSGHELFIEFVTGGPVEIPALPW